MPFFFSNTSATVVVERRGEERAGAKGRGSVFLAEAEGRFLARKIQSRLLQLVAVPKPGFCFLSLRNLRSRFGKPRCLVFSCACDFI